MVLGFKMLPVWNINDSIWIVFFCGDFASVKSEAGIFFFDYLKL